MVGVTLKYDKCQVVNYFEALFGLGSGFERMDLKRFEWTVCRWEGCLD